MKAFATRLRAVSLGLAMVLGLTTTVLADDWQAFKLRGGVFAFVDEQWQQLARGDVVPDDRIVRTAPNGRVQFKRGAETIDLGPDTQIRIFDRDGEKFTVVQQHFGDVAIEAERRDIQHFAVQTRNLAAVVKGTRFTVSVGDGVTEVDVNRGKVQVRDVTRSVMTDVAPGQSASVGSSTALSVSGSGKKAPIVKFVGNALAIDVTPVAVVATTTSADGTTTVVTDPSVPGAVPAPDDPTVVPTTVPVPVPGVTTTVPAPAVPSTEPTTEGTPAVANTSDTPAGDVVADTPAATNTPPENSNAGGKKK